MHETREKRSWLRTVHSYMLSIRAAGRLGACNKLRRTGRLPEALQTAREGLALLRTPTVVRDNPAEGSALLFLTMAVEQISHELKEPGADFQDLFDSAHYLRSLNGDMKDSLKKMRAAWLPYLEERLSSLSPATGQ